MRPGLASARCAVELAGSRQIIVACNDALDSSADTAGRAEFDGVFSFGHVGDLCTSTTGSPGYTKPQAGTAAFVPATRRFDIR